MAETRISAGARTATIERRRGLRARAKAFAGARTRPDNGHRRRTSAIRLIGRHNGARKRLVRPKLPAAGLRPGRSLFPRGVGGGGRGGRSGGGLGARYLRSRRGGPWCWLAERARANDARRRRRANCRAPTPTDRPTAANNHSTMSVGREARTCAGPAATHRLGSAALFPFVRQTFGPCGGSPARTGLFVDGARMCVCFLSVCECWSVCVCRVWRRRVPKEFCSICSERVVCTWYLIDLIGLPFDFLEVRWISKMAWSNLELWDLIVLYVRFRIRLMIDWNSSEFCHFVTSDVWSSLKWDLKVFSVSSECTVHVFY